MEIKNISVVGGGTMGNGIVTVFAVNDYNVNLIELNQEAIDKALKNINSNLERMLKKESITNEQKLNALNKIKTFQDVEAIPKNSDLVIEAVYENKEIKSKILNKINKIVKDDSIIASNTSSISITELSNYCKADKFIGMHFFNPVPVMKLIEIVRGYSTSDETFNIIKELSIKIGKTPVEVKDFPGFISNRILMPMINEAIFALMEGVATAEDIDTVMKLGMNHPMGPLTLADFIGLDVCLSIMEVLYNGFNDSKYRPCPLLKQMVNAKKLGRKTGEGFFKY